MDSYYRALLVLVHSCFTVEFFPIFLPVKWKSTYTYIQSASETIYFFSKWETNSFLNTSRYTMMLLLFLCYQAKRRLDRCLTTIYTVTTISIFSQMHGEIFFSENIDLSVWLICMGKHNVLKRCWQLLYRLKTSAKQARNWNAFF